MADISKMTIAQVEERIIKHMVDRFLGWQLPKTFSPDCGISFNRTVFVPRDGEMRGVNRSELQGYWPVGTNLLTADEATEMVKYMMAGLRNGDTEEVPHHPV